MIRDDALHMRFEANRTHKEIRRRLHLKEIFK